ncbi:hypothetical protein ACWTU6_31525, partial [Mesorhizobium sp. BHbsci]
SNSSIASSITADCSAAEGFIPVAPYLSYSGECERVAPKLGNAENRAICTGAGPQLLVMLMIAAPIACSASVVM